MLVLNFFVYIYIYIYNFFGVCYVSQLAKYISTSRSGTKYVIQTVTHTIIIIIITYFILS